ncbi:MAG: hypothetical protein RIF37_14485 [Rhodospirillaceae bacterium]|jgi:hypothetical protein
MDGTPDSGGIVHWLGEVVGGFLASIPPAIGNFFTGVGQGAGVYGWVDWAALIIGIALLISGVKGLMAGRVVGSILSGAIGLVLMSWAVS